MEDKLFKFIIVHLVGFVFAYWVARKKDKRKFPNSERGWADFRYTLLMAVFSWAYLFWEFVFMIYDSLKKRYPNPPKFL